jgi:hypothetical protein
MTSRLLLQFRIVITKQLVIIKQLKLYFNNSSRIPTPYKQMKGWSTTLYTKFCIEQIKGNLHSTGRYAWGDFGNFFVKKSVTSLTRIVPLFHWRCVPLHNSAGGETTVYKI